MGTGMHKLIVVGAVVAALGIVAPAFGKPALPEGYQLRTAEPNGYPPQAVQALGERGQAIAKYVEESTGYSPQALQALGERGQAMAGRYGVTTIGVTLDANQRQVEPTRPPVVVAGDGGSFDWNQVGIGIGVALLLAGLGGAALTVRTRERVAHP